MADAPVPAPGKPSVSGVKSSLSGIPTWGWIAAAGVFVLVLAMYARRRTTDAATVPVGTGDTTADGAQYDESQLRSSPINYEGNLFGTGGPSALPVSTPSYAPGALGIQLGDKSSLVFDPRFGPEAPLPPGLVPGVLPGSVPGTVPPGSKVKPGKAAQVPRPVYKSGIGWALPPGWTQSQSLTGGGAPVTPGAGLHTLPVMVG